jgi:prepilin-type N-terminal cleavage/methylation domain-containing protein
MKNMIDPRGYAESKQRGFTLIELLVVIAIIALLSSVVLASLSSARVKARDATRLSNVNQIKTALALYIAAHGTYPKRNTAQTDVTQSCGGNSAWCGLVTDLAPYIQLPTDPNPGANAYRYYYDSDSGNNYQTYGFMVRMEDPGNYSHATGDKGYYNSGGNYYEVGQHPTYCRNKYTGTNGNWWGGQTTVCVGGN